MAATLGERLRALRESAGWTQIELATRLGVGNSTVSQYEGGHRVPDADTLVRLAQLFKVTLDHLLGNEEQPDPNVRAILRSMKGLTEVERQDVLDYIAWKQAQHRKRKSQEQEPKDEPDAL